MLHKILRILIEVYSQLYIYIVDWCGSRYMYSWCLVFLGHFILFCGRSFISSYEASISCSNILFLFLHLPIGLLPILPSSFSFTITILLISNLIHFLLYLQCFFFFLLPFQGHQVVILSIHFLCTSHSYRRHECLWPFTVFLSLCPSLWSTKYYNPYQLWQLFHNVFSVRFRNLVGYLITYVRIYLLPSCLSWFTFFLHCLCW